jgi:hypothetical protein
VSRFICTHNPGDDRPPAIVPIYLHKRGNASKERKAEVDRELVAAQDAMQRLGIGNDPYDPPRPEEPRNEYLDRAIASGDGAQKRIEDVRTALSSRNHHQLQCPACGFTERVSGTDLEALIAWAEREGLKGIPLRSARRIIQLMPPE